MPACARLHRPLLSCSPPNAHPWLLSCSMPTAYSQLKACRKELKDLTAEWDQRVQALVRVSLSIALHGLVALLGCCAVLAGVVLPSVPASPTSLSPSVAFCCHVYVRMPPDSLPSRCPCLLPRWLTLFSCLVAAHGGASAT